MMPNLWVLVDFLWVVWVVNGDFKFFLFRNLITSSPELHSFVEYGKVLRPNPSQSKVSDFL